MLLIAFVSPIVVGLGLVLVMNRRSPEFKLQRSVRPVVLNKLAQRECVPLSMQIRSDMSEHELAVMHEITNAIASSLSIKPEQLRLSERLLNTLILRRRELTPEQAQWLDQSPLRNQDHVLSSLAFEPVAAKLFKMLGPQGPRALDLRNRFDFEDFILCNSLELVIQRISEIRPTTE